MLSKKALASTSVLNLIESSAFIDFPAKFLKLHVILNSLFDVKSLISLSLSTTNLTATD